MEERQDTGVRTLTDEINELLEKLKFLEEETTRVVSTSEVNNARGFESWAIDKIMAIEPPNKEAMYRVFKSLWFTKEEVDFVALKEGPIALVIGNAIGELVAIDWKDRNGGWTEFMRLKVKINALKSLRRIVKIVDQGGHPSGPKTKTEVREEMGWSLSWTKPKCAWKKTRVRQIRRVEVSRLRTRGKKRAEKRVQIQLSSGKEVKQGYEGWNGKI
ncbi:hypothetical protein Goarm_023419 [Gossypium armourianum]|uniref:Uncharacterized protein n=1 Tax=Gossypium armourianum TaxID=34283 RepID=A0A7J9KEY1_9ROSI|nr:hypothetical protein [Gossypium armourianum]